VAVDATAVSGDGWDLLLAAYYRWHWIYGQVFGELAPVGVERAAVVAEEAAELCNALLDVGGNVEQAAREVGMSRSAAYRVRGRLQRIFAGVGFSADRVGD
jgi:hypothetical protein